MTTPNPTEGEPPSGPGAAILLAASIGAALLGALVVASEAFPAFKTALNWWAPAGPLTGKAVCATVGWLISWAALHVAWRRREIRFAPVAAVSTALICLGLVLTFPPVYEMFTRR